LKEVKYFSFFGEYDPPEPKYIRDEKQKNEYARRIKEFSGLSKEITKKLKKLFPDSKLSPYWLVFYNKTDNDGLYVIDWLGETKDFTDFFCYCNVMPRENILNRDNVRKMLFEKAQVDFPVWIAAQRGATETAFPLAYSMGYEYMAPEGDGMVCHYGGYDDVNSISRGHLCDVYGYPNYSYLAMYTVIKMLSGAERKGISRLGQSIYCCKYKKADDYIYYLWSSWYNGENIALSTDADKIILRDIMGNDRTISLNDPDLNLKVSYWPIQLIAKKEIKLK
jgi:predicted RNA-binding protein